MDGSTRQQDPERANLNGQHRERPNLTFKAWLLHLTRPNREKPGQTPKAWLLEGWLLAVTPVANGLNAWQRRVSLRTRNRVVLTGLGFLFLYALYSLIVPFL